MTKFSSRSLAALVAASAMMTAPLAMAQQQPAEPQAQQPQAQQPQSQQPQAEPPAQAPGFDQAQPDSASVAEEDLKKFAVAAIQVQQINQIYAPQVQEAQSPDEQQLIRQQANEAAAQAVTEAGLSVEQYNDISRLAVQNPQVAEKVTSYIEEAMPEQQQAPQPQQPQQPQ